MGESMLKAHFFDVNIPLVWDIDSLLLANLRQPVEKRLVRELIQYVSLDIIDDAFGGSKTIGPIILAEVPWITTGELLIDGSHRVIDAFKHGDVEIEGIKLPVRMHLPFMLPYSAFLFKFLCNTVLLSYYAMGKTTLERFYKKAYSL